MNSELPAKMTTEASARKEKLVKADVSEFIEKYKQHFEMIYPSVGQLVTLLILTPEARQRYPNFRGEDLFLSPSVATCSLVTINNQIATRFGLTCLHAVKTSPCSPLKYSPEDYEMACFFVKSEVDIGEHAWKLHDYFSHMWTRPGMSLKASDMIKTFIDELAKKMYHIKPFIMRVQPCEDLLQMRKEFIINAVTIPPKIHNGRYEHPLLDPEFGLQPIPSIDILAFELPPSFEVHYATYLKSTDLNEEFVYDEKSAIFAEAVSQLSNSLQKKSFAYINIDLNDLPQPKTDKLVALVGYQNVKSETIGHQTDDLYRKSLKAKFADFSDAEFMNENLSIGFCSTAQISDTVFTFKGNTTEGSSGSPILDEDLRLLGINFGCYYDYQTDESLREKAKAVKKKESRSQSIKSKSITSKKTIEKDSKARSNSLLKGSGISKSVASNKTLTNDTPKSLFEFDVEMEEPGAKDHEESLKNRNLAISINHPVLVSWLKNRQARITKDIKTKFPPLKDKIGSKENFNPTKGFAKR